MKKRFFIITVSVFISLSLGLQFGSAQGDEEDSVEAAQQAFTACFKGWRQFVSSLLGYRSFLDYWYEIIEGNICYRTDLEALTQQANKARELVRSTFLRCDLKNLERYSEAYYKHEAELYFMRNMLLPRAGKSGPVIDKISDPSQLQLFAKEMRDYFVLEKGFLTEAILQQYIEEFTAKHRSSIETYRNCNDNYFEELSDKIEEIKNNFKDFGKVFEKTEEEKRQEAEEERRLKKLEKKGFLSQGFQVPTISGMGEDLDLNFGLARAKVVPEKSLQDLADTLKTPDKKNPRRQAVPHIEVSQTANRESERVKEETNIQELKARYEFLYAQVSDRSVRDMRQTMDGFIGTIGKTQPFLEDVTSCVNDVEARECKNKK